MEKYKDCWNCKERHEGCHSECPKYLAFRAQQEKLYEIRKLNLANATARANNKAKRR